MAGQQDSVRRPGRETSHVPALQLSSVTPTLPRSVLIGDSIERFSLDYFCEVMDGDLGLIDPSHPWSPAPFQNGRDELREDAETVKTWVADGRPHWCRISDGDINLNLLSFFMCACAPSLSL